MTIDKDSVAVVSTYVVSDSGEFTEALFALLSADAKEILDVADPGLSATLYDRAHALMVCHLYAMRDPELALKSMSHGGYSFSRDAGVTAYSLQYDAILAQCSASLDTSSGAAVTRCDAEMTDLNLDGGTVPTFPSMEE